MWRTGLVAPRHVGSSQTRARTCVPCIGRRILNRCVTREAHDTPFLDLSTSGELPTSSEGQVPGLRGCWQLCRGLGNPSYPVLFSGGRSCVLGENDPGLREGLARSAAGGAYGKLLQWGCWGGGGEGSSCPRPPTQGPQCGEPVPSSVTPLQGTEAIWKLPQGLQPLTLPSTYLLPWAHLKSSFSVFSWPVLQVELCPLQIWSRSCRYL